MTSFCKKVSIVIKHDYFGNGQVSGLSIFPTPECQRLLRNYQQLLKNTTDGLDIYRDEDENTTFTDELPAATMAFDFLLAIDDQQFLRYTNLPAKKNDELYLFSNKKGKTAFQLSTVPKVQSNSGVPALLGVVRLCFNFSAQATLTLNFTAPQLKWKYYVLTGAAFPDPVIDGSTTGINFIRQSAAAQAVDQVGQALATGYPTATISVFESDKKIPVINTGRKNIQLKKAAGSAIVINNLPNPDPGENGIKIINLLN